VTVKRTASAVIDPFCLRMAAYKLTATSMGPNDHPIHLHRLQCAIFVVNFDTSNFVVVHIRYKCLIAFIRIQKKTELYGGKSLNNKNFIIAFLQEYLQKLFVSYFST